MHKLRTSPDGDTESGTEDDADSAKV